MGLAPGKQFEKDFKDSIPDRCDVTRLIDAGGWSRGSDLRFTPKNPCDMIVFSRKLLNKMYKLELKSTLGKSLPYGNIKQKKDGDCGHERAIKFVQGLCESENKGVWAGFIVNFRDVTETYRVRASVILGFMQMSDRKSFPLDWFQTNGILIKQTLKKVHYRYDLEWM